MNSLFELQPILIGKLLRLRPLKAHEFDALFVVASDPLIWELHPEKERYKKEVFEVYFKGAIESGGALVVEDLRTGKIIGCSRFYEFKQDSSEIFIGYTFLARDFWGGEYNREMKKLMLDHAFKYVDSALFQVGSQNLRSRGAMTKIGGKLIREENLDGKSHVIYEISRQNFTTNSYWSVG